MAPRGRKPRPALQVIREGNPGHRPVNEGVRLPPSALLEPDWAARFPADDDESVLVRHTAARLWARTAPTLARSVGLVGEQQETLVEYCIAWARIVQGERAMSRDGVLVPGRGGQVRNPWATVLNQYRAHFRSLAGELGLTPSSATRLARPLDPDDEDDPFDGAS